MKRKCIRSTCGAFVIGSLAVLMAAAGVNPAARADPAPLELVQTIVSKGKPGKLDHLAIDTKHNRLFLAYKVNNTIDVFDLKENKLLQQIPNQSGVQGLAYAPDLDRLFAALGTGGFCNVFEGQDYKLVNTVKFENDADNVRYDPRTNLVYVAHATDALGVIDAKTGKLKTDIKLDGPAEAFRFGKGPASPLRERALGQSSCGFRYKQAEGRTAHVHPQEAGRRELHAGD